MRKSTDKLKVVLSIFAVMAVIGYAVNFYYAVLSKQTGGTFGDTFGISNALFSGGALVMLIYAIILQRDELGIVKEERKDTKTLLAGQETINRRQKDALDRQLFEQSFFSLLSLISEERQRGTQKITDGKQSTFLGYVGPAVSRSLEKGKTLEDLTQTPYLHKFSSLANLIIAAHVFLEKHKTANISSPVHFQSLCSFVDEHTSRIIVPYVLQQFNDPLPVFSALGCLDRFTQEELEGIHILCDKQTE